MMIKNQKGKRKKMIIIRRKTKIKFNNKFLKMILSFQMRKKKVTMNLIKLNEKMLTNVKNKEDQTLKKRIKI